MENLAGELPPKSVRFPFLKLFGRPVCEPKKRGVSFFVGVCVVGSEPRGFWVAARFTFLGRRRLDAVLTCAPGLP
jgi:hypothetical protein